MNPAAEALLGFAADELLERPLARIVPPDRRAELVAGIDRLSRGERVETVETVRLRKDGSRVPVTLRLVGLREAGGNLVGVASVMRDLSATRRTEEALRARTAELRMIMEMIPATILVAHDPEGRRITGSRWAGRRLHLPTFAEFGLGPALEQRRVRVLRNGIELPIRQRPLMRAAGGEEIRAEEIQIISEDGSSVFDLVNASPVRDADGRVIGAVSVGIDISERKQAEDRQRRLMDELDHRVKNVLATVQALARHCLGGGAETHVFVARLQALARTHELLSQARWSGVDLRSLLERTLGAYIGSGRTSLDGPETRLSPRAAQALGLVLHELATNAAKYGALAAMRGRVVIAWRVEGAPAAPALVLFWREMDGPAVQASAEEGFGLRLIRGIVRVDLGGSCRIDFRPTGLRCKLRFPLLQDPAGLLGPQASGEAAGPGAPGAG